MTHHPPETAEARVASVTGLLVTADMLPPLGFSSDRRFDSALVEEVVTTWEPKPSGGLWLSPLLEDGTTRWQDWCGHIGIREPEAGVWVTQQVHLRPESRVVMLDSREALDVLAQAYPVPEDSGMFEGLPADAMKMVNTLRSTPFDFAAAAADGVAAVWVTQRGLAECRRADRARDEFLGPLYLWDVESVLVLNPDSIASCGELL